jgi:methionine sulfoxide reductase heme-binding subunit
LSTRLFGRGIAPAWLLDLHRHLGALATGFTALHMFALVADSYVEFGARELLVPMASPWKTGAVAYGIMAMWLMLLVEGSSLMMHRLGRRAWRTIHTTSFIAFVTAAAHGVLAGTDAGRGIVQVALLSTVMVVMFLTIVRILAGRGARRRSAEAS